MIKLGFIFIGLFFISIQITAQETVPELKDEGNAKHLITAQEVDPFNPVPYVPMDFTIPLNPSSKLLKFTLRGGDGGWAQAGSDCKSGGGDGAVAEAEFIIGNDAGQLPAGSEIRFIVGIKGKTDQVGPTSNTYGGGGGGTAVLARFPGNTSDQDWIILAVAGGGGGAYQGNLLGFCVDSQPGEGGRSGTSGGNGGGTAGGDGGTNGNGGAGGGAIGTGDLAGGGGGAKSNGGGNYCIEGYKGQYEGGLGGYDCDDFDYYVIEGGWGFGGGGAADDAGGGGGGYSGGGGGGVGDNGGGGSSYVNAAYAKSSNTVSGGSNSIHQNGEASYQFEDICATTITGFEYVNAICSTGETGRVQLIHGLGSGNICSPELYFTLSPDNGWSHLGNGLFKSLKAGIYTASVVNSTENIVVDSYTFTVGVTDEAPTAVCKDVTVYLTDGSYSNPNFYMVLDDGSSGPCDISLAVTHTSFDCDDIGVNTVFMQAIGSNNVAAYCSSQVTVEPDPSDAPVASCVNTRTINLDNGTLTLVPADIDNGSTIGTCAAGMTISPSTFDCDDIGAHTVTLRVTASPTSYTECTTTVTITDNKTPTANCKPQITLVLDDNGVASLKPNQLNNISTSNNCTPLEAGLDQSDFDCTHVGDNQVTLTVHDGYGRTSSCSSTVTVQDNIAPVAICQDITVGLDENGQQTITADQLDGGSTDLCDLTFSTSNTTFTCADIGTTSQILTVTDQGGNQHSCTAQVTIADNLPPKAICSSYELQLLFPEVLLGPNELRSLTPSSTDNCSGTNLSRSIERSTPFTCADVGVQEVTIRLTDDYNNSSTCTAILTVVDRRRPSMACQGATIQIGDNGSATLTTEMIDAGSNDYCGIDQLSLNKDLFDCDDIGTHSVTLTATDVNGNIGTCTASVEVQKTTGPIAKCQNLTVFLDENGYAEIEPSDIDNGSSDVCGLSGITLDQSSFDCEDMGIQILTLTASNYLGNSSTCQATVSIEDNTDPVALCKNITLQLDENGEGSITAEDIDNGSYDACGTVTLFITQKNFYCNSIGDDYVTLFVTDSNENHLNTTTCSTIVKVQDNVIPVADCQDITVGLDANGVANIIAADIDNGSSDACGIASLSLDRTDFSCADIGYQSVTLTATDNNGNKNTCQATVSVEDEIDPTLTCSSDMIVATDEDECGAMVLLPKAAPLDNCGISNLQSRYRSVDATGNGTGAWSSWLSDQSGFFDLGRYEIQWRAKDASNNKGYCSHFLDIIDEQSPEVICHNIELAFNGETSLPVAATAIFDADLSFDACGEVSFVSQSTSEISCAEVGNTVEIIVTGIDPNGNTSHCTAQVTVVGMPCSFEATDIDCEQGAAASYDPAEDAFTLSADDCSGYPQGEFSYVGTELCGDGEITVKVSGLVGDGRAGVVMMESTDSGARRVSMLKSQTRKVTTEYRTSTNGSLYQKHKNRSGVEWVRIVRIGNKFKTYTSTNGSSWKLAHTLSFSNFANCVQAGIMTYSRRSYDPVTATFEQLTITSYSNTALTASPTGTSATMADVTEQSRDNYFPSNDLMLEVAPNPFSDQTKIEFELMSEEEVILEVYNLQGQRVNQLIDARLPAGSHQAMWTGADTKGQVMPTGVYLLRLQVGQRSLSKKISLIRN